MFPLHIDFQSMIVPFPINLSIWSTFNFRMVRDELECLGNSE